MKTLRPFFLFLLPALFLLTQSSCIYYQRYSMAKTRLQKIDPATLSIYLVDAAHPLTRGWYVSEPKFEQKSITGFISRMAESEILEVSMLRDRADARESRNDILIYAKPQYASALPDTAMVNIEHTQLEKIEVCELNEMKTVGRPLLGCTGALVLLWLVSDWF